MQTVRWWQTGIIYQIYPRSFQDTDGDGVGDLRGITQRLPYLVELGVDAIWISPIFASPMADFGYDVADYTDIDPLFGTLADFDAFLDAAVPAILKCHPRSFEARMVSLAAKNNATGGNTEEHTWPTKALVLFYLSL